MSLLGLAVSGLALVSGILLLCGLLAVSQAAVTSAITGMGRWGPR
jgi:hypothetical protein